MNKKSKKIIAREILIFLGSIIIFLISFLIYNSQLSEYKQHKSELYKYQKQSEEKSNKYISRLYSWIDEQYNPIEGTDNLKTFRDNLKEEEYVIKTYRWLIDRDSTFSDDVSLNKFKIALLGNNLDEIEHYKILNQKIKKWENSYFSNLYFDWILVTFIFSITFGMRYLIYVTIWSIKQL